jgi:hypothetical protein
MRRLAAGMGIAVAVAVLARLALPSTPDGRTAADGARATPPVDAVAGPDPSSPDAPTAPADPWAPEAMRAAAARALSRRLADERTLLAAGVAAAPVDRRAALRRRSDAALARMEAVGRRVESAEADPIEAYTEVEQVKRALLDEVRRELGADADPVLRALRPPDAGEPGWGIPVDELGWSDDGPDEPDRPDRR